MRLLFGLYVLSKKQRQRGRSSKISQCLCAFKGAFICQHCLKDCTFSAQAPHRPTYVALSTILQPRKSHLKTFHITVLV